MKYPHRKLRTSSDELKLVSHISPRGGWPESLQIEHEENKDNGVVGSVLVSETDSVRVWHLHLPRGKQNPLAP